MVNPADINWTELVKKVDAAEPQEGWGWDGDPAKVVFLGTVFSLTPSGKYYTSWWRDEEWWAEMEVLATKHRLWLTFSEGDPRDIMVGKFVEV